MARKTASAHVVAQRRYAARLIEEGIPRADDLARAVLHAAALCAPSDLASEEGRLWRRIMGTAVNILADRGFERAAVHDRLVRTIKHKWRSSAERRQ